MITWTSFNYLALPTYDPKTPLGAYPSVINVLPLPGGGFYEDSGGAAAIPLPGYESTAAPKRKALQKQPCEMTYGGLLIDNAGDLYAQLMAWVALRGTFAYLRRTMEDASVQAAWACLTDVLTPGDVQAVQYLPITLKFMVFTPWIGEAREFNFALPAPTGSPDVQSVFLTATSTLNVSSVKMTFTPAGTAVTKLRVYNQLPYGQMLEYAQTTTDWQYEGTVLPTQSLVIDGGQMAVTNNAVDDYANLFLNAAHQVDGWFDVPGICVLKIERTGGSANDWVKLEFSEIYE